MKRLPFKVLFSFYVCTCFHLAQAGELSVEPGRWEAKVVRTNPMTGQKITETNQRCIESGTLTSDDLFTNAEGCEVLKNSVINNRLQFEMACAKQGMTTKVKGDYSSNGTSGQGVMTMEMKMGENTMKMEMTWQGKRLGPCFTDS